MTGGVINNAQCIHCGKTIIETKEEHLESVKDYEKTHKKKFNSNHTSTLCIPCGNKLLPLYWMVYKS